MLVETWIAISREEEDCEKRSLFETWEQMKDASIAGVFWGMSV